MNVSLQISLLGWFDLYAIRWWREIRSRAAACAVDKAAKGQYNSCNYRSTTDLLPGAIWYWYGHIWFLFREKVKWNKCWQHVFFPQMICAAHAKAISSSPEPECLSARNIHACSYSDTHKIYNRQIIESKKGRGRNRGKDIGRNMTLQDTKITITSLL